MKDDYELIIEGGWGFAYGHDPVIEGVNEVINDEYEPMIEGAWGCVDSDERL